MTNLKESFEEAALAKGDVLVSAVVGLDDRADRDWNSRQANYPVQSWETASQKIDYGYDSGFGGADCHAVIAWGVKFVYFVHEYDGATSISCVPRNPQECIPGWADVELLAE